MKPQWRRQEPYLMLFVADGHSGRECVETMEQNSATIFDEMFRFGPERALEWAADACRSFRSGAMIAMARLHLESRVLEICSVGDASCNVYVAPITWGDGGHVCHLNPHDLFHHQRHHDPSELSIPGKSEEMAFKNIRCTPLLDERTKRHRAAPPVPDPNGTTLHWSPTIPALTFRFPGGASVAASSFVGHRGCPTMAPNTSTVVLPLSSTFRIVMHSDGVSDVMDKNDAMFTRSRRARAIGRSSGGSAVAKNEAPGCDDVTAETVASMAKSKWFGELLLDRGDGRPLQTMVYAPTPKHADDISVLVVSGVVSA